MKRVLKTLTGVIGILACAFGARAMAVEDNPYHAIVERNVFDLKPPPPPVVAPTVTNAPPPNVKLTGITSILGSKQALFMVGEPSQPGKPPSKEESYILLEGQRQGALEVLEIDQKAATVKIKIDGNESLLTLDTSPKLPSGPGAAPGGAPAGPGGAPHPNFSPPGAARPASPFSPVTPTPAANPFASGNNNPFTGASAAYGGANNNAYSGVNNALNNALNNGLTTLPTRTLRTDTPALSPEEDTVVAAAQALANKNNPHFPPVPPPISQLLEPPGEQQSPGAPGLPNRPGFPPVPGH